MKLLDVVRLQSNWPNLPVGAVGTVVELLDADTVLVDFADNGGVSYAIVPVPVAQLAPAAGTDK